MRSSRPEASQALSPLFQTRGAEGPIGANRPCHGQQASRQTPTRHSRIIKTTTTTPCSPITPVFLFSSPSFHLKTRLPSHAHTCKHSAKHRERKGQSKNMHEIAWHSAWILCIVTVNESRRARVVGMGAKYTEGEARHRLKRERTTINPWYVYFTPRPRSWSA